MKKYVFLTVMCVLTYGSAHAESFRLQLPLACEPQVDCFVQNYMDTNVEKGPEAYYDYRCGPNSYDGHDGTDFRLLDERAMAEGVNVLAAADGEVKGVRDGVQDVSIRIGGEENVQGKECGNGVLLQHINGWQTQYCHMKQGSILVQKGQIVKAGDILGQVGMSGMTEFPHLHLSVRKYGKTIDPFMGIAGQYDCNSEKRMPLWTKEVEQKLAYHSTSLLGAGFAVKVPTVEEVQQGLHRAEALSGEDSILVFWVQALGVLKDDPVSMTLLAPDGTVLAESTQHYDHNKAQILQIVGKQLREGKWPSGVYSGKVTINHLAKDGGSQELLSKTFTVKLGK